MPQVHVNRDSRKKKQGRSFVAGCFVGALLLLCGAVIAQAQTVPSPSSAPADMQSNGSPGATLPSAADQNAPDDRLSNGLPSASSSLPVALPASQILRLLDGNPDLVVELKSLIADRMREQGTEIDENDISDQMLYSQIAESASVRVRVTAFLRARGYVTADELDTASAASSPLTQRDADLQQGALSSGLQTGLSPQDIFAAQSLRNGSQGTMMDDRLGMAAMANANNANTSVPREPRAGERGNSSTDVPQVLRRPAPYNLRSMRDVYTQIPEQTATLKRFGSDVFVQRGTGTGMRTTGTTDSLDVPVGPDYVLGPGDTLQIDLWGGVTQSLTRTVGRDGRVMLPEAGSVEVAGMPLARAEQLIEGQLRPQFRNAQVAVSVARLHTVRVYVVGDVQRPGAYEISSLATPVSALYAAGGPTAVGSLRLAEHMRGTQLVETVDLYDFLLRGVRNGSARFQSGDTLRVPAVGAQVAIAGAVKRPAIYELKTGENALAAVFEDAGGLTAAADLDRITIERIDAHKNRQVVTVPPGGDASLRSFSVQDGDRVFVRQILPYSERAIYLEGHVARPGKIAFHDGMQLSDVLHSYRDLLPEPAEHGEIVRLSGPDLHAETIEFRLSDVLIGNVNMELQPFDTVRVLGRYEADAPKVKVLGEVLRPGDYPMSQGMTAAQLVRMAGGFKRDALLESADLASYEIVDGHQVLESVQTVRVGAAMSNGGAGSDVPLKPGDVLSIHQITGWNDIGQSVRIDGQVKYPGSYGFKDGERLSTVLERAGGLLPTAYPTGAVLIREQVRDLEQKSREELIRQIEATAAGARLSPAASGSSDAGSALQLIQAQHDQALADLRSHPPSGRMVIHISEDIASWANTTADVELRAGDVLTIPKQPGFVLVTGQVYNATALTFTPGKTAGWYLSHAGGTNTAANRREVFVIRANGSVIGRHSSGWLEGDVLSTKLEPGDVVVVPQKIIGASYLWRNLLSAAQIASSIAITTAVAAL
jgi:protein involved in polysaccharide export with SLBB domain